MKNESSSRTFPNSLEKLTQVILLTSYTSIELSTIL